MQRISLLFCSSLAVVCSAFAQSDPASEPAVIAVGKVWPAVVNINTEGVIKRTVRDPREDIFNQFFGREVAPPRVLRQKVQSLGSGFIIDSAGYIVTNEHVVERAADMKIHVTTSDGKTYEARYIAGDKARDLALIKIDGGAPFPFIALDDPSPNLLGESVLAVGNPLGYGLSVSRGILSALNRTITIDNTEYKDLIQTDAAINPGNSGGPLIDISGRLVGVNSVKMAFTPQGVPTQGIGFAIPNILVRDCVRQFLRTAKNPSVAKAQPPQGQAVAMTAAESAAQKLFGLQIEDVSNASGGGARIADVETGGPAEQAGLKRGMVIYKIGRFDVSSASEAEALFEKASAGMVADLVVGGGAQRGRARIAQQTVSLTAR